MTKMQATRPKLFHFYNSFSVDLPNDYAMQMINSHNLKFILCQ